MTSQEYYIEILNKIEAINEGHFILSSGLHSNCYIQCAKIFSNPELADKLCCDLAQKIHSQIDQSIDYVVSPAMGGVIAGYEIARQLNTKAIFCERVNGIFEFRRGFHIKPNDNILIVEDVLTTGKSSLETFEAIKKCKGNIVAEACIIDRRENKGTLNDINIISLIELEVDTFDSNNIPEHLKNIEAIKPGSRFLKA